MTAQREAVQMLKRLFDEQAKSYRQVKRAAAALAHCIVFSEDEIHERIVALDIALAKHGEVLGIRPTKSDRATECRTCGYAPCACGQQ